MCFKNCSSLSLRNDTFLKSSIKFVRNKWVFSIHHTSVWNSAREAKWFESVVYNLVEFQWISFEFVRYPMKFLSLEFHGFLMKFLRFTLEFLENGKFHSNWVQYWKLLGTGPWQWSCFRGLESPKIWERY